MTGRAFIVLATALGVFGFNGSVSSAALPMSTAADIHLAPGTAAEIGPILAAARVRHKQVVRSSRHVAHPPHHVARRPDVVHHHHVAVVRPVRPWAWRPYYGTAVAGVVLGTVIVASAAAVSPKPPSANLCWYWADPAKTMGYWDYCR